jgi:hypothetical protein
MQRSESGCVSYRIRTILSVILFLFFQVLRDWMSDASSDDTWYSKGKGVNAPHFLTIVRQPALVAFGGSSIASTGTGVDIASRL